MSGRTEVERRRTERDPVGYLNEEIFTLYERIVYENHSLKDAIPSMVNRSFNLISLSHSRITVPSNKLL